MSGSTIGRHFRITTFGESHGPAVGVVIDGVRPGIPISVGPIQAELDRRRPGQSRVTSARKEDDKVQILSGVFEGRTTGTPLCMVVWNKDQRPEDYRSMRNVFRPGHAGYVYLAKYGIADFRGGGRSSGRETVARVAAGAFAKLLLGKSNIRITGHTIEVGGIRARRFLRSQIEKNSVRCADPDAAKRMERRILKAMREGDSVGGIVEVIVENPPVGLGDPVFDKLDADLAKALMSIGTVKGVEIGAGFGVARLKGSENNDPLYYDRRTRKIRTHTNNSGGIVGGISNGEDIVIRIAVKPPSSIARKQRTVTHDGKTTSLGIKGRHDPCICPRVVPVAEAMTALVLIDHMERQARVRGKSGRSRIR
jgi:chorismate synthase